MTIHKAGYILLLKILIVLIILNLASFYFINNTSIVYTILGITVVMYLLVVNFFRFPNRDHTRRQHDLSPCRWKNRRD